MGLFGREPKHHGGSNGLGGDYGDKTNYTSRPKSCGKCHGTGQRLNGSGRPVGGKCKACKGRG